VLVNVATKESGRLSVSPTSSPQTSIHPSIHPSKLADSRGILR